MSAGTVDRTDGSRRGTAPAPRPAAGANSAAGTSTTSRAPSTRRVCSPSGMFFLDGDRYLLGAFLLIVANAAQSVSMVLYNAYLPQIAEPHERDRVSSRGWAFGYTSGAFVLVLNLVLCSGHESFGMSESTAVRICLASAGLRWGAFTLVPLRRLRDRRVGARGGESAGRAGAGWRHLIATVKDMRRPPHAVLPAGLSGLQRRRADGDLPGLDLRIRGARPRPDDPHHGDPAGPGARGGRGARHGPAGPAVRGQAHHPGIARRLDPDGRRRLLPAGREARLVLHPGGGDRPGPRRTGA